MICHKTILYKRISRTQSPSSILQQISLTRASMFCELFFSIFAAYSPFSLTLVYENKRDCLEFLAKFENIAFSAPSFQDMKDSRKDINECCCSGFSGQNISILVFYQNVSRVFSFLVSWTLSFIHEEEKSSQERRRHTDSKPRKDYFSRGM